MGGAGLRRADQRSRRLLEEQQPRLCADLLYTGEDPATYSSPQSCQERWAGPLHKGGNLNSRETSRRAQSLDSGPDPFPGCHRQTITGSGL